jgi:Spy/CpxP family protein refolding chaperone
MKKKVIFLTLIVAVVFMVLSMASFADARSRGNFGGKPGASYYHHGQDWNFPGQFNAQPYNQGSVDFRGMMNLDLSAEQIAEIRQIMLDSQKETLELRNQIQVKQLELRELRLDSEIDMDQVKSKLEEIADLQVELRMKAVERQGKVKELLTPEQLENCGIVFHMQGFNMGNDAFGQGFKGSRGGRW